MPGKVDFLTTCNEHGVSEQDFEGQFCSRCLQQACVRSLWGKSKFEDRVATWRERLFTEVPRMAPTDPRLPVLQAKKFVDIDMGRIPEINSSKGWIDPRDLDETPETSQAVASAPTPEPEPLPEVPVPAAPTATTESPTGHASPNPMSPMLLNTPAKQGVMLGGRVAEPPKDPWAVTPQETQGLRVVKPGAKIKLGGSGV